MGGSDDQLVQLAAKGDEDAFAAIYRRHGQDLYRFCLAMTGNASDAQEALQNTMVKVLRALPGEEREIKLKPWLYRIARNESVETRRRRRHSAELDNEAVALAGVAETAETRERLRLLLADLAQLPERQRATLIMREIAGLEFEEIATTFDTTSASARQTLYEARLRLRQLDEGRETGWDEEVTRRRQELAAIAPLPFAGALGGMGAGKALAASALFKAAATVAVTAVVVTAADRAGLVELPLGGGAGVTARDTAAARAAPGADSARAAKPGTAGAGARAARVAARRSSRRPAAVSESAARSGHGGGLPSNGDSQPPAPDKAGRAEEASGNRAAGAPDRSGAGSSPTAGSQHPAAKEKQQGSRSDPPEASNQGQETAAAHKPPQAESPPGQGPPSDQPGQPATPASEAPGKPEAVPGEPEATPGPEAPPEKPEAPQGHTSGQSNGPPS